MLICQTFSLYEVLTSLCLDCPTTGSGGFSVTLGCSSSPSDCVSLLLPFPIAPLLAPQLGWELRRRRAVHLTSPSLGPATRVLYFSVAVCLVCASSSVSFGLMPRQATP